MVETELIASIIAALVVLFGAAVLIVGILKIYVRRRAL